MAVPKGKVSRQRRDKRRSSTWKLTAPSIVKCPNCGAFCMLAGMIIVPLISLITPAPDRNKVEKIFACYDRTVVVRAKDSIGSEEE